MGLVEDDPTRDALRTGFDRAAGLTEGRSG
jgi:hypothetical protein